MFITREIDGKKYHAIDPSKKRLFYALLALAVLIFLPLISYAYYSYATVRPAQNSFEKVFEIESGESAISIADKLYAEDLVNSKALFIAYLTINKYQDNIQAGVYKIPAGASIKDLSLLFQNGREDENITFIEGWRAEEIARKAESLFPNVNYEKLVSLADDQQGYLFPDTYTFNKDITSEEIVSKMRSNFDKKTSNLLTKENLDKAKLTKEEVVNLAAIVEREVSAEKDRPVVAGILIKRYKNGELVGADATSQYAVAPLRLCSAGVSLSCYETGAEASACGVSPSVYERAQKCLTTFGKSLSDEYKEFSWWPHDLTLEEIQFDSAYNTRKNTGLPPSPIANPSYSALEAVIDSVGTKYNYYLTDPQGTFHYAVTLEEHNINIARYLQ